MPYVASAPWLNGLQPALQMIHSASRKVWHRFGASERLCFGGLGVSVPSLGPEHCHAGHPRHLDTCELGGDTTKDKRNIDTTHNKSEVSTTCILSKSQHRPNKKVSTSIVLYAYYVNIFFKMEHVKFGMEKRPEIAQAWMTCPWSGPCHVFVAFWPWLLQSVRCLVRKWKPTGDMKFWGNQERWSISEFEVPPWCCVSFQFIYII